LRFPNVTRQNNSSGEIPLLKVWDPALGFLPFQFWTIFFCSL